MTRSVTRHGTATSNSGAGPSGQVFSDDIEDAYHAALVKLYTSPEGYEAIGLPGPPHTIRHATLGERLLVHARHKHIAHVFSARLPGRSHLRPVCLGHGIAETGTGAGCSACVCQQEHGWEKAAGMLRRNALALSDCSCIDEEGFFVLCAGACSAKCFLDLGCKGTCALPSRQEENCCCVGDRRGTLKAYCWLVYHRASGAVISKCPGHLLSIYHPCTHVPLGFQKSGMSCSHV